MDLSAGQSERDGTTVSVNEGMDLAHEAASGTAHAAIIGSPFLPVAPCWWTRTQVESIITILPSKAAETAALPARQFMSLQPRLRLQANGSGH